MTRQKIEPSGPRADLAKAIEAARDAEAHCEALRASMTRINDQLYEAQGQLERAGEEDEEAKTAHVRAIVAGGGDLAMLHRPARSAVLQVEQTIEACKSARQMVKNELAEAEQSVGFKALRVRSAVGDVLAAEALGAMIADAGRLKAELEAHQSVLSFLHPLIPREHTTKVERALAASSGHVPHPGLATWRAALDLLMVDASAELPA